MEGPITIDKTRIERTDARFRKVEIKIHCALRKMLKARRVAMPTGEFCQMAKISRPTLHTHCAKIDDALHQYEQGLREEFGQRLLILRDNELIFAIMLGMIRSEQEYFFATVPNHNYWLLDGIFEDLRPKLTSPDIDNLNYEIYIHHQIAIISCWVKFDSCASAKIPFYTTELNNFKLVH